MGYATGIGRVLTAMLLIAFTAAATRLIDARLPVFSSIWIRLALITAILFATVGAIALFHQLLSPSHSGIGLDPVRDGKGPQLRRGLFIGAGGVLVFLAIAVALQEFVRIPVERTLLIGFGIGLAWGATAKPWWFWEHWKAQFLRKLIGDNAVVALYLVMALLLLYAAVFGDLAQLGP